MSQSVLAPLAAGLSLAIPPPMSMQSAAPEPALAFAIPSGDHSYSESERVRVLAHYAETNNLSATSRATGVPRATIWRWMQDDECADLVTQLRNTLRSHVIIDLVEGSKQALRLARERLAAGDPMVVGKRVELVPVKAKDCAIIASVMIDKATLLTGQIASSSNINSAMDKLADELLRRVDAKASVTPQAELEPKPSSVIDVSSLVG